VRSICGSHRPQSCQPKGRQLLMSLVESNEYQSSFSTSPFMLSRIGSEVSSVAHFVDRADALDRRREARLRRGRGFRSAIGVRSVLAGHPLCDDRQQAKLADRGEASSVGPPGVRVRPVLGLPPGQPQRSAVGELWRAVRPISLGRSQVARIRPVGRSHSPRRFRWPRMSLLAVRLDRPMPAIPGPPRH
jgi:hypothetical protein